MKSRQGVSSGSVLRATVVDDCLEELQSAVTDLDQITLSEVRIGTGYTGVRLSSGHIGLAYSLLGEYRASASQISDKAGHLTELTALELARMSSSWDMRARVLGIATLNALSQLALNKYSNEISTIEGDIVDSISVDGKVVTVVGNMRPTIKKLKEKAKQVFVLERSADLRDETTLPDTAAEQVIPESNIVLITGTAIENGTVDRLLELSQNAEEVAVVGATAGLLPTVLFKHGATAVGAIKVIDGDKVMQIIAEGGGTPSLMQAVKFAVYKPRGAI